MDDARYACPSKSVFNFIFHVDEELLCIND